MTVTDRVRRRPEQRPSAEQRQRLERVRPDARDATVQWRPRASTMTATCAGASAVDRVAQPPST
jgi:hypothetical protein